MKAVLVIDEMPMNCDSCQFGGNTCIAKFEKVSKFISKSKKITDGRIRPSWCPLRPLPQREKANDGSYGWIGMVDNTWTQGFNDCLAEITGEME